MVPNLAPAQEVVSITLSRDGEESKDQLDQGSRGNYRHRERRFGSDARLYTNVKRSSPYAAITPSTRIEAPEAVLISAKPASFVSSNAEPGDDKYGHPFVLKEDANKNYLAVYSAKWCTPCRLMYPVLNQLREEGYIVYYIDADTHPEAVKKHQIKSLPTFIIMNKGQEASRIVGVCLKAKLKRRLKTREEQESQPTPKTKAPQLY